MIDRVALPVPVSPKIGARRLINNTAVQLVGPGMRILLGLVLAGTLSRYLGAAGFGQYSVVFAYVALFTGVLADWGLGTICLREIARRPAERVRLVVGSASLQAAIALAVYLVMLASVLVVPYPSAVRAAIAIYGITALLTPLDILALTFQADLRLARLMPPSLLGTALNFILVMAVIAGHGTLVPLVLASLTGIAAQYVWTARLSLAALGGGLRLTVAPWAAMLREAWPLALSTTVSTALQQAPLLALSLFSLGSAGLFTAANKIPQQLFLLPLAVRATTFPILSASWVTDRSRFRRQLGRLVDGSVLIAIPCVVGGIAVARPLMRLVFGSGFDGAAVPFAVMLLVFALMFPGILVGEALIAAGFQRLSLLIQAASLPALLALLVVLVPVYGATGAALALLGSYAGIVAGSFGLAHWKLGATRPVTAIARAILALSLGLIVVAIAAPLGVLPGVGLGVVASMATLVVLGGKRLRDARTILSAAPSAEPAADALRVTNPTGVLPRVAIVTPVPYGDDGVFGGGERYADELAQAMSKRTETVLVTVGRERRHEWRGSLRVEVHPWITLVRGRRQNPLSMGFLQSLQGVDIVHCLAYSTLLTDLSVLFARLSGKKAFITDVGGGADVTVARFVDVTRLAHALLLISQRASREFAGGQRSRHVIYAGIDIDRYRPGSRARQRRVLFVGRLLPHKGITDLIDAVDHTIPLTIAGRPYDAHYFQSLKAQAAGKDVSFVTDATDADLLHLYQTSAVCVLPSVYRTVDGAYAPVPELLGFTLMEAMACATPVVCTDVGSLPELVRDGISGYVVPPNQPRALRGRIDALLGDPIRARAMGEAARQTIVQRFTWDHVVDRCLAAYQEAAA